MSKPLHFTYVYYIPVSQLFICEQTLNTKKEYELLKYFHVKADVTELCHGFWLAESEAVSQADVMAQFHVS